MAQKSDNSALINDFNKKRNMISKGMREIFIKAECMRIKPYTFGLARDGGFCIFLKGEGLSHQDLEKIQGISKQGGFLIYVVTENQGYIIKPNEIKIYENEKSQKFRELVSNEISRFHMRFINP